MKMQINFFRHQSIYHRSALSHLHRLPRTLRANLSSLLPLLLLQFFSITVVAGQTATRTSNLAPEHGVAAARTATTAHQGTSTTAHPSSPHTRAASLLSTASLPTSSAANNPNKNNFHHHPTTLSTDDLTSASSTVSHRRHRIPSPAIPASDTLLNSIPIFPLDYDNLQPPKENGKHFRRLFAFKRTECALPQLPSIFKILVLSLALPTSFNLIYLFKSFFSLNLVPTFFIF